MATLTEIVAAVQAALQTVDVASIPATPPENLAEPLLPALVVYASTGGFRLETASDADGGWAKWGVHTVYADLHITRSNLALDIATAMPFAESIANALFVGFRDGHFDGTVTLLGQGGSGQLPIRYALVEMNWGGLKTVGWRFEMDVAAESTIA